MRTRLLRALIVVAVLAASVALTAAPVEARARPPQAGGLCAGISEPTGTAHDRRPFTAIHADLCLRLNQIQVMGTHNSYRQAMTPEILEIVSLLAPAEAEALDYEHAPLRVQFDDQEIRQIELDVFADPDGGHLAERLGLDALGLPNETPPALLEPGFKVLHAQEIDFNTHCLTLVECLTQVEAWSDAHPGHLPITVLVELKEATIPDPLDLGFVTPIPFDGPLLDALDAEIRSVMSPRDLITPDDVRGWYPTLDAAVRAGNWPTLGRARGKVMFVMNNAGHQDLYTAGHPSLRGRVMFTNAEPGDPDAAFVKVDTAPGNVDHIRSLVERGYVVRTRADVPTVEARSGDTTRRDAAFDSGAQWVSTDYPVPGMSRWSDYVAQIPGGDPARCNPVNTGPRCESGDLERLPWWWLRVWPSW